RRARSTVRERNVAIWSRETVLAGSYVVGVVPVVMPSVKISRTNGQKNPSVTSVNGPHAPKATPVAPPRTEAVKAATTRRTGAIRILLKTSFARRTGPMRAIVFQRFPPRSEGKGGIGPCQ